MILKHYYIELGKLLFAIAKSDAKVQEKEILGFKKLILSELLKLEDSTDQFGTDNAFFSEFEFIFRLHAKRKKWETNSKYFIIILSSKLFVFD